MLRNACRRTLAEAAASFSGRKSSFAWRTVVSDNAGSSSSATAPTDRAPASRILLFSHQRQPARVDVDEDAAIGSPGDGRRRGGPRRELHPWSKLPLQIAVAMGVASFWRGAWYVMDTTVFPDDTLKSGAACLVGGTAGLAKLQRYAASEVHRRYIARRIPPPPSVRYGLLYGMGLSCVAVCRCTWCLWDAAFEAFDPWALARVRSAGH